MIEMETRKLTWADLVRQEPGLAVLEREIRRVKPTGPHFCANAVWYGYGRWRYRGFKARMGRLVGWDARNPALRTREAYDLAYEHLYDLLPACRDCLCA